MTFINTLLNDIRTAPNLTDETRSLLTDFLQTNRSWLEALGRDALAALFSAIGQGTGPAVWDALAAQLDQDQLLALAAQSGAAMSDLAAARRRPAPTLRISSPRWRPRACAWQRWPSLRRCEWNLRNTQSGARSCNVIDALELTQRLCLRAGGSYNVPGAAESARRHVMKESYDARNVDISGGAARMALSPRPGERPA